MANNGETHMVAFEAPCGQYRGKSGELIKITLMKLTKKQKAIIYGVIFGDGYLQKTGTQNARLRVEHSKKQEAYAQWLYENLENIFSDKPKRIDRVDPKNKKTYEYVRLQSNASPWFGKLRQKFYDNSNKKVVPSEIALFLESPLSLAVWYMDDGYYYARDKSAHFYLPNYNQEGRARIISALKNNFDINATAYCRPDRNACHITINGADLHQFKNIIKPYLIPSMRYKLPLTP